METATSSPNEQGHPKNKSHQRPSEKGEGVPAKKVKKEEPQEKWKWWEEVEVPKDNPIKWKFLEHKGPIFAPPYEPLPADVNFKYNGKVMKLMPEAEEVMTFYAKMLDHDYTTKKDFNKNFFGDWRKVMTAEEESIITDLDKCDFVAVSKYFKKKSEERKARSKEEKLEEKKKNEALVEEYGFCNWDHHKEKIGNFRLHPSGLFRGRGNHPKMGKLRKRILPKDIIINCSKDSMIPKAPAGQKWKEVRHDNTVTWLVSWTENVQGQNKYIMLNPNSRIKGEKDWQKYEIARMLNSKIDSIRKNYMRDLENPERMMVRQRAVALYFIDKLALRAGNKKKDGESADTVGCCSLRCEHINLHKHADGKNFVVEFDFLGKDSIRYYNKVPVLKQIFENLSLFMENKEGSDYLFDRLTTTNLNKYLTSLMDGLTAKVFRTYNASITLQNQLKELTDPDDKVELKVLSYDEANREVAVLCNHRRASPKNFNEQMGRMNEKEENKTLAPGTSKLNYLDPRITVAWCKKYSVPVEKVYNKTQRDKFAWAIAMVDEAYEF